jgi:hypothetical protein
MQVGKKRKRQRCFFVPSPDTVVCIYRLLWWRNEANWQGGVCVRGGGRNSEWLVSRCAVSQILSCHGRIWQPLGFCFWLKKEEPYRPGLNLLLCAPVCSGVVPVNLKKIASSRAGGSAWPKPLLLPFREIEGNGASSKRPTHTRLCSFFFPHQSRMHILSEFE